MRHLVWLLLLQGYTSAQEYDVRVSSWYDTPEEVIEAEEQNENTSGIDYRLKGEFSYQPYLTMVGSLGGREASLHYGFANIEVSTPPKLISVSYHFVDISIDFYRSLGGRLQEKYGSSLPVEGTKRHRLNGGDVYYIDAKTGSIWQRFETDRTHIFHGFYVSKLIGEPNPGPDMHWLTYEVPNHEEIMEWIKQAKTDAEASAIDDDL